MVAQPLLYAPRGSARRTSNNKSLPYPNMLRAFIKDMGYTMREVSHETDLPQSSLRRWASGKTPLPHYAREKLAPLLCCSVEDLAPRPQYDVLPRQAIQAPNVAEMLTALVEQPDVQRGLFMAHKLFLDSHEPAPLTEEEMIDKVETNLSRRAYEQDKAFNRVHGGEPISYLYNLGYVLGSIGQGLVYAHSSEERESTEAAHL